MKYFLKMTTAHPKWKHQNVPLTHKVFLFFPGVGRKEEKGENKKWGDKWNPYSEHRI